MNSNGKGEPTAGTAGERHQMFVSRGIEDQSADQITALRAALTRLGQDPAEAERIDTLIAEADAMFGSDLAPFEDPEEYGQGNWPGTLPHPRVTVAANSPGPRSQSLSGFVNCTVLLTDVVGFGALNRSDQDRQVIRNSVLGMVQELLGPVWEACVLEDRGDGLLIVAPPQVPTARIMESVHRRLPGWLRLHNRTYNESARIRLRIAVNVGPVIEDSLGMAGDAIIRTARLVDAPALKKAMAVTGAAMGIIVSEFVYETALMPDLIDADEYKLIEVSVKESSSLAWMRLLEAGPPALRSPLSERQIPSSEGI